MIVQMIDGRPVVSEAQDREEVTGALLDLMEQRGHPHYVDGLYVFDDAGEYRYRKVGAADLQMDTWVLERVR